MNDSEKYALNVLNVQLQNLKTRPTDEQDAFCEGLRVMLEVFTSEGYTKQRYVAASDGKAEIWEA